MRYLAAISLVVLLVAGFAQGEPLADRSGKFTIEIAQGWTQGEGTDLFNLTAPNKIAQVSISSEDAPDGLTLAIFKSVYVNQAKQSLSKFSLSTKGDTKIDGTPAGLWVYTAVMEGVKLKFKNVVCFKNGKMYNIIFCTLPDLYANDVKGFDKMLASWKWL